MSDDYKHRNMDSSHTSLHLLAYLATFIALIGPLLYYLQARYLDPMLKVFILRGDFDQAAMAAERRARGKAHFAVGVFGRMWVLTGAHAGRWLLVQQKGKIFSGKESRTKQFHLMLAGSIIDQEGAEHARTRRLLAPAFKTEHLRNYLPRMVMTTTLALEHWASLSASAGTIDLQDHIKQLTLRFAFTLLIGANFDVKDHGLMGGFMARYKDFIQGMFPWPIGAWGGQRKALAAREKILQDVEGIIRERLAKVERGEDAGGDPLWALMTAVDENGDRLSVKELANQALLLVFAGHETTASILTAFAAQCIRDASLMSALRAEQDALPSGPYTNDTLKKMPLLDAAFRETERVYNLVPMITRGAREDMVYIPPDGSPAAVIRKGDTVAWDITGTNRDPDVYDRPDVFDHTRWLVPHAPEDVESDLGSAKTSVFTLATFGAGHRVCIGMQFARMEMLVIGGTMIREYDFGNLKKGTELKLVVTPQLKWRDGVQVEFNRRKL